MKLVAIKIKNFKVLKDVNLRNIPDFAVFLGANGAGKSTLFNVFDFLKTAIELDIHQALYKYGGSGGFDEVRSRDSDGDIYIELTFNLVTSESDEISRLVTYLMRIGKDAKGSIVVNQEVLRMGGSVSFDILNFKKGVGKAQVIKMKDIETIDEVKDERLKLKSPDTLAIKGLAQFERFDLAVKFGELMVRWHFSDIHVSKMRGTQDVGSAKHLSRTGDNLYSVIENYQMSDSKTFKKIKESLQRRVPGVADVKTQRTERGEIFLKIQDRSFEKPFLSEHVSHGTVKILAYLALLYDPEPHSLLFVEEPENQLYHSFLEELAEEFRSYAIRCGHVFVATHSPIFLDAAKLNEVFFLVKKDGYTAIRPAAGYPRVKGYMENGDKMGRLWAEGFFQGVGP